jgi:hypothetical protein
VCATCGPRTTSPTDHRALKGAVGWVRHKLQTVRVGPRKNETCPGTVEHTGSAEERARLME